LSSSVTISSEGVITGMVSHLPSSKSLSNRALIIEALTGGGGKLENLSEANDTRLMKRLVHTTEEVIDAEDAGTVMRFLTAYYALTGQKKVLTGTPRMQQRPIRELVDALRTLGAIITYESAEGYPPVRLKGFPAQQVDTLRIRGDISSQFISAIMMMAPTLPSGLTLSLTGRIASRPYLEMTAALMSHFGVTPTISSNEVRIPAGKYTPSTYKVEPDWSAASYWFAIAALAGKADLLLPNVQSSSLQGDRVIVEIMSKLGVQCTFEPTGLRLSGGGPITPKLTYDFSGCPDLAQTVLPVSAVLGVPGEFTGLESLRIKETDRLLALQKELGKIGATLTETGSNWVLSPCDRKLPATIRIATYEDHRMAMGFAPLATRTRVTLDERTVVRKSYPDFWEDLKNVGFTFS
jgi:3-phosphoshikimate 1-carboxyvinyltransferase